MSCFVVISLVFICSFYILIWSTFGQIRVSAPHDHGKQNQCWTPHAGLHGLVLLTMGIMVSETCWDKRLKINLRLAASCWFLSLPCIHVLCGMSLQAVTIVTKLKNNDKYISYQTQQYFIIQLIGNTFQTLKHHKVIIT